ncbi:MULTISPECIES: NAD-dependent epimerase/dehydratase family protein [unclassified Oleiphilus]|uniref:NAD-dependent epimerase/dehydratase family protein n=1 Tax=unclassified Oleiphilus TaxID=2631174 RepID=UPI0018D35ADE|nr:MULTISPECIES: NAD-dependent epimerase/dehydratase family protein [unclassified Oleiphilus]
MTGAGGFIGTAMCSQVRGAKLDLVAAVRQAQERSVDEVSIGDIDGSTDWSKVLQGVDVVIHLAGKAHFLNQTGFDFLESYRTVNTLGTINLVRQSIEVGVKRFIYISTAKVNGEHTNNRGPYSVEDFPFPKDAFSISKMEAEYGLKELALASSMEYVIIRPPLVYGPGVKANFSAMMKLAMKNVPLPLGAIENKRSLVSLQNLSDLIMVCLNSPKAVNQTFFVSDEFDISTPDLLRSLVLATGKESRILYVPPLILKALVRILRKKEVYDRLCSSFQVDISYTKNTLDWTPPVSFQDGISRCFDKAC